MNPPPDTRSKPGTAFYVLVALVAILAGTFLAYRIREHSASTASDEFSRQINLGKSYLDGGEPDKAIAAYQKAVSLNSIHPDAHLNLANAYLRAGQGANAAKEAQETLKLEPNSPAALYVMGCGYMRLARYEEALKYLQQAKNIDPKINAVSFQIGRAHQELGHYEDAAREFDEVIQFEPDHPAANYNLSQVFIRLGRQEDANKALERHRQNLAKKPNALTDASTYERCVYTEPRVPFELEQPAKTGVKVNFVDATQGAFGAAARNYHGPIGVLDINHRGQNDIFVAEGDAGFRLLLNTNGSFQAQGEVVPGNAGARYTRCLVGDLNNDRFEDAVMLGDKGLQVFRFATNGGITDATAFAGLKNTPATDGALVDLDFTGKLDLVLVTPGTKNVRVLRNLGNMYFKDITQTSGVPAALSGATQLAVDDWNNDDLMDLFVARGAQPALLLTKQRGGTLTDTNSPPDWPAGQALAVGDLNNDFRTDAVIAAGDKLECIYGGLTNRLIIPLQNFHAQSLLLVDYDNDGWLDLCAYGDGVRIWRNLGQAGFREMTRELGLDKLRKGKVEGIAAADFDGDGDTDLLLSLENQGLQLLRNDGGNANQQLKLRLLGNRSNASGLGIRVEVSAGRWRTMRTVAQLPVEIGVGTHRKLDAITVHWFDLSLPNSLEGEVDSRTTWNVIELQMPTGSCPYLYAWDGRRFRFVTDLLGAAPLGLRLSEERFVDADTDELVWIGDESSFKPRAGNYDLQVTEELREVLYLDEAKLVVVDHPAGTEVHPSCKLVPAKPWPAKEIFTLHERQRLRRATRLDGVDVTGELADIDGRLVSPIKLRVPQLRGLAEPHGVILDFGPLAIDRPLVLALTGWLRFGGGMANVAASHNPDLPFPFPTLEVETGDAHWVPVKVTVGAPAGKTKTILVDLTGKLPPGGRRLRLSTAFEIHWDRIALFEKRDARETRITWHPPSRTDLHWRGFSEFADLSWQFPLTPVYETASRSANWRITPMGWCTRYGAVNELLEKRDDTLVLLNGGDELTLNFPAASLPEKPPGYVRDFFLYSSGWDKDADFHCERGWLVEPLPWHGMDDQLYGQQARPVIEGDAWIRKYNTRWVGQHTLQHAKK